jgi:hypothetical protein
MAIIFGAAIGGTIFLVFLIHAIKKLVRKCRLNRQAQSHSEMAPQKESTIQLENIHLEVV